MADVLRLPMGQRLRNKRLEMGIGQAVLASQVGISATYLNLIEHDKRSIGGRLLHRIAQELKTDLDSLTGAGDIGLVQELVDAARALGVGELEPTAVLQFVARDPEWAQALITANLRYQDAAATATALSDRLGQDPKLVELTHAVLNRVTAIKSLSTILHEESELPATDQARFSEIISVESNALGANARDMIALLEGGPDAPRPVTPRNEVDDFLIASSNYFPELEQATQDLRGDLGFRREMRAGDVADALSDNWDIHVVYADLPAEAQSDVLVLDPQANSATHRFQIARRLVEVALADAISSCLSTDGLTAPESRQLATRALASYAAGALLAPYDAYLHAAEAHRYDLDRLGFQFSLSFEQAAHRLVTLRKPGSEGIPFAFLRADPAGNLSKPFSTPGLRMPRVSGACPLWALYEAFSQPDRIISQMAVMPQGERYLFIARRLTKRIPNYGAPSTSFSVMLGCDAIYADRVVYGDGFAVDRPNLNTPTGYSCASCARENCAQRAQAYVLG